MLEGLLARLAAYWELIAAYMPSFLEASWVVMEVTVLVILLSWLCGLLAAFGKTARNPCCAGAPRSTSGSSAARRP